MPLVVEEYLTIRVIKEGNVNVEGQEFKGGRD